MNYIINTTTISLLVGCLCGAERESINVLIQISDVVVKHIDAKRSITVGLPFEFRDLQNETNQSETKTIVSGFCDKEEGKYRIISHRITIKNNKVVRSDWFNQSLDPKDDEKRAVFGSVSMGSATLFDIRLKPYSPE